MARKRRVSTSRRDFLSTAGKGLVATSVLTGFPSIVPSSVLGAFSPANRINIGAIGNGRISRVHDLPGIWNHETARIMAVCDLDSHRAEDARTLVNEYYGKQTGKKYDGVTAYGNYQELLANKDVDAVVISTPDHWHALIAIHAVRPARMYCRSPRRSRSRKAGRSATPSIDPDASFRSAASSDRHRSSVTRRSSCETDESANYARSRSGFRVIRRARSNRRCPCRRI
jgi:hypothetical protein